MSTQSVGYNQFYLGIDVETSGLFFNEDDPSYDPATGKTYQIVSVGLVVTDSKTLKSVKELYLEIKWNGESEWSPSAAKVHGLTLEYLEENGCTEEEAVADICELIMEFWGPKSPIILLGHNVATFDRLFFVRLMRKYGINLKIASKSIDTNTLGAVLLDTHNSDDLFAQVGIERTVHNSLDDARAAVTTCRLLRKIFNANVPAH